VLLFKSITAWLQWLCEGANANGGVHSLSCPEDVVMVQQVRGMWQFAIRWCMRCQMSLFLHLVCHESLVYAQKGKLVYAQKGKLVYAQKGKLVSGAADKFSRQPCTVMIRCPRLTHVLVLRSLLTISCSRCDTSQSQNVPQAAQSTAVMEWTPCFQICLQSRFVRWSQAGCSRQMLLTIW
jgi:hypothetical protein